MTSAEDLFSQIADLAPGPDPQRALAIGRAEWDAVRLRDPNPHDAETCRLLSLAALELSPPEFVAAEVWRIRALTRFTLIGWHEGVAVVVMGRALATLSMLNDDYIHGRTLDVIVGSDAALDLLNEMSPFLDAPPSSFSVGDRSHNHATLTRMVPEKRGFLLLTLNRLDEALASYEVAIAAADAAGSSRGVVKSRAGRALVHYLMGHHEEARAETLSLAKAAVASGSGDVARDAGHNAEVMGRGGRDLRPYEIL